MPVLPIAYAALYKRALSLPSPVLLSLPPSTVHPLPLSSAGYFYNPSSSSSVWGLPTSILLIFLELLLHLQNTWQKKNHILRICWVRAIQLVACRLHADPKGLQFSSQPPVIWKSLLPTRSCCCCPGSPSLLYLFVPTTTPGRLRAARGPEGPRALVWCSVVAC